MSNRSPRESVDAVLAATKQSSRLYGHGLGMIASENIISPNVKRAINSDLHGRYAEGLPESDTTKVVMILIPSKVLESIWRRRYFRPILRTYNQHLERFQTLVLSKHWRSQAIRSPRFRQLMEVTFRMLAWVLLDCEILTSQRTLGMKNVWNPISMPHANSFETYSQKLHWSDNRCFCFLLRYESWQTQHTKSIRQSCTMVPTFWVLLQAEYSKTHCAKVLM